MTESIYRLPHIAMLMATERAETNAEAKRLLHNSLLAAIKAEQIKRGQRTEK